MAMEHAVKCQTNWHHPNFVAGQGSRAFWYMGIPGSTNNQSERDLRDEAQARKSGRVSKTAKGRSDGARSCRSLRR